LKDLLWVDGNEFLATGGVGILGNNKRFVDSSVCGGLERVFVGVPRVCHLILCNVNNTMSL